MLLGRAVQNKTSAEGSIHYFGRMGREPCPPCLTRAGHGVLIRPRLIVHEKVSLNLVLCLS
jgi:hypothetical protein